MEFKANDRVTIFERQLHGNAAILIDGQIASIEGSHALVAVDHETVPRSIPLKALSKASNVYGSERTGLPNEKAVIDAIRR